MTKKPVRPVPSGHGRGRGRRSRNVQPRTHDTYKRRAKPAGSRACTGCGAVFARGRWTWLPAEAAAVPDLCPACRRIRDRYPAGRVRLGAGFEPWRDEVLGLIRNVAAAESAEHPLERLMARTEDPDGLEITTTGAHLARRIAAALERRFPGRVRIDYPEGEGHVRVEWAD